MIERKDTAPPSAGPSLPEQRREPSGAQGPGVEQLLRALVWPLLPDPGEIPWNLVLSRGARDGVRPLLYDALCREKALDLIPETHRSRLRACYLATAQQNVILYHQLALILGSLRAEGIRAVALKGAHLAELVYRNVALRPMGDIDLLIPGEELSRAGRTLAALGYACTGTDDHHVGFRPSGPGVPVELHWELASAGFPFRLDAEKIRARTTETTLAGAPVRVLSPEDLLLHLSIHGAYQHAFAQPVRILCDLERTLAHHEDELDGDLLWARAEEAGVSRCLGFSLFAVQSILGAPWPDGPALNDGIAALDRAWMETTLDEILCRTGPSDPGVRSINVANLAGSGGLSRKLRIVARAVFPRRESLARMYGIPPGSLRTPLLWPLRVRDLVRRHGRDVWRVLRQGSAGEARLPCALRDWLGAEARGPSSGWPSSGGSSPGGSSSEGSSPGGSSRPRP